LTSIPLDIPADGSEVRRLRDVLRRDGPAALTAVAATLIVELGALALALTAGAEWREATLLVLGVSVVWVCLACPALAAGGKGEMSAALRAGIVADASLVALVVLWLAGPHVTFGSVVKVYCTLAVLALFSIAAVRCAASPAGRAAVAVAVSLLLMMALSAPLWTGGLLSLDAASGAAGGWVVRVSPAYSIASSVPRAGFIWHEAPVMYSITWVGDLVPAPPVEWYTASILFGGSALVLSVVAFIRIKRRRARGRRLPPF